VCEKEIGHMITDQPQTLIPVFRRFLSQRVGQSLALLRLNGMFDRFFLEPFDADNAALK
jgi:hypothetical protein